MNGSFSRFASLRGSPYRHCFVSFPHHWKKSLAADSIPTFELNTDSHSIILSWAGHTHDSNPTEEDVVYVSSKLLWVNDFKEGTIMVRQITCPPPCSSVSMRTVSENDWEELMLNVETAQDAFLNQVRVVKQDQSFPLWLEGGIFIRLVACNLSPTSSLGLMQLNTQVQVFPPTLSPSSHPPLAIYPSKESADDKKLKLHSNVNFFKILQLILMLLGYTNKTIEVVPQQELYINLKVIPFSIYSIKNSQNVLYKLFLSHPSLVILSKECLKTTKYSEAKYFKSKITKVKMMKQNNAIVNEPSRDSVRNVLAFVMVWEELKLLITVDSPFLVELDVMLQHRCCLVSNGLKRQLELDKNATVILETWDICVKNNLLLDISMINYPCSDKSMLASSFQSLMSDVITICPVVLNSDNVIHGNVHDKSADFIVCTRDGNPIFLDNTSIHCISINVESECSKRLIEKYESVNEETTQDSLRFNPIVMHNSVLKELIRSVKRDLRLGLNLTPQAPQFIMLQGPKGSGKSFLIQRLMEELSGSPFYIHCKIIHMKQLKGKKVDSIQKILRAAINEGIRYQPSLILLDDLDFLTPVVAIEEERGPSFEYVRHLSFMMRSLFNQLLQNLTRDINSAAANYITVVATCCSRSSVHSALSNPKGNYLFTKSVFIPPLSREQKVLFLHSSIETKREAFLKENNITRPNDSVGNMFQFGDGEILEKLDGFMLQDINSFAQRVFLEAKSRWLSNCKMRGQRFSNIDERCSSFTYETSDVSNALQGFLTLASRALNSSISSTTTRKIGGLRKCKDLLEEMVVWPSKYPEIFSQTRLKLRSGILLYGPPGCGKTLLANSVKNYPHLSFITVKGPELLSKYIGQSEKSVRDVFERAENSKPCVLFFDEFESIAPRRGHDNTGVTDRVVNQLLTQMDGVEGLAGVYVLAATSRPDLIDPALLRPGRLDKGIHCSFPTEIERQEILEVLSEEVTMSEDVDFKYIAKMTDGFTGADLQSIISNAQIIAAQKLIGKSLYESVLDQESGYGESYPHAENVHLSQDKRQNIANSDQRRDKPGEFGYISYNKERYETSDNKKRDETNTLITHKSDGAKTDEIERDTETSDNKKRDETNTLITHKSDGAKRDNIEIDTDHRSNFELSDKQTFEEKDLVYISQEHLVKALKETYPSVSYAEQLNYEKLHQMFTNSKDAKLFMEIKAGNRETLA